MHLKLERAIGVVFRQPVECGTQIVVVTLQPCRPLGLRVEAMFVGLLGKRREERRVATAQFLLFVPLPELLEGVLADGLEHEEPVVADRLDEAVVDKGAKVVELRAADLLGRLQGNEPEKTEKRAKSSRVRGSSRS